MLGEIVSFRERERSKLFHPSPGLCWSPRETNDGNFFPTQLWPFPLRPSSCSIPLSLSLPVEQTSDWGRER